MPTKKELHPKEQAALTKRHTENARAAIQVSNILTRLTKHVNGLLDVPMDSTQIQAAKILLAKAMPDLTATEFTDVTPDMGDPVDIEQQWQEAVLQQAKQQAQAMLNNMTREQIAELTQDQPLDS